MKKDLKPEDQEARPETNASGTSRSSDKAKKTIKTENEDKTENDGKTENERTENDGKTSKSGDSDHESDDKTPMSPENKEVTTVKEEIEKDIKQSTIIFEDEAFKKEKFLKEIDANLFIGYLIDFYEEEQDILIPFSDRLDTNIDERAEEAYKAATDLNYDPFKEKLQRTLEQYEAAMDDPEGFRNPKERDIAAKVVNDLRNQLLNIDRISKKAETERDMKSMIKSVTTSIEDRRIRGLREIFGFYAQQHLPEGLEFGDIQNKKNILDLGEFLIFTKDFQLPLNKNKIIEVFKKTSSLRQLPVNFEEFLEVIKKIGVEMNKEKILSVKKRLKEIRKLEREQQLKNPPKEESKEDPSTRKEGETTEKVDEEESKEETSKNAKETSKPNESKTETFDNKKDAEESESKSKTGMESKKSIGQISKSGAGSDEDSESESKLKTTKKTKKTSRTSKADEDSENESESGSESPLTSKSKNKSVRFSTLGKRRKSKIEHSEIGEMRSQVVGNEGLSSSQIQNLGANLNPIQIQKEKLEAELEKFTQKSVEMCHEDIMNYLE